MFYLHLVELKQTLVEEILELNALKFLFYLHLVELKPTDEKTLFYFRIRNCVLSPLSGIETRVERVEGGRSINRPVLSPLSGIETRKQIPDLLYALSVLSPLSGIETQQHPELERAVPGTFYRHLVELKLPQETMELSGA